MRDYIRYFPQLSSIEKWGLWVSASGIATVKPGHPYPPTGHPPDHHFEWKKGRTLDALQILWITDGEGTLEFKNAEKMTIGIGAVVLLLPGVWHRYRPNTSRGWRESWIEIRGPLVDGLLLANNSLKEHLVCMDIELYGIEEAMKRIHALANDQEATLPELSVEALRCLSLLDKGSTSHKKKESNEKVALRAERYLAEHHAEPLEMKDVAHQLGLSYSNFRRIFRIHTNLSPWQYVIRLRLERGRRLLSLDDSKLDEIARKVGFSSAFHFSTFFKKTYGISPSAWKKKKDPLPAPDAGIRLFKG